MIKEENSKEIWISPQVYAMLKALAEERDRTPDQLANDLLENLKLKTVKA